LTKHWYLVRKVITSCINWHKFSKQDHKIWKYQLAMYVFSFKTVKNFTLKTGPTYPDGRKCRRADRRPRKSPIDRPVVCVDKILNGASTRNPAHLTAQGATGRKCRKRQTATRHECRAQVGYRPTGGWFANYWTWSVNFGWDVNILASGKEWKRNRKMKRLKQIQTAII